MIAATGGAAGLEVHTCPEGSGLPVVVVVGEAREARQAAVVSFPLTLLLLSFLLPPPDLVKQLGLCVNLMGGLPVEQKQD